MLRGQISKFRGIDVLWLVFLGGLALLSPVREVHKQLTLAATALVQIFERRLIAMFPRRGPAYSVLLKIALASLLLGHTGGAVSINSSYYPIYYLPVITAAIYFGPVGTLLWTALASAAYCSYLLPVLQEYELTPSGEVELGIRILFFFFAAILVNQFVMENRRRLKESQALSETLAESNRQLKVAQDEARRSERLAALGQLSAGLAHEIRNPLGVIKGSAEMLNQKLQGTAPLAQELAGYIYSEVNRLNALVARFLDFARPSRLQLQPVSPAALVNRALDAVQAQFPGAKIAVERRYADDLPQIQADEQLCEQVFVNLICNAYEAMNGSGGKLRVSIAPASAENVPGVAVEIQDSGPGVPAELREQIFNPFFTSKENGVGLGLSIVAKIVDDHRGAIRLKSPAGEGACFHVFLPAKPN
ncbi:MAG TPA: ATP-binding protein [Terriglobales bacterium]|nr:ATP-binding protein [Terriglobales bacterium]